MFAAASVVSVTLYAGATGHCCRWMMSPSEQATTALAGFLRHTHLVPIYAK